MSDTTDDYTTTLATLLEDLDTLEAHAKQLAKSKTATINQLLAHLGVNRKALMAFLARRKLSAEDRAHYDASLHELCNLDDEPLQPGLFDLATVRVDGTSAVLEVRRH